MLLVAMQALASQAPMALQTLMSATLLISALPAQNRQRKHWKWAGLKQQRSVFASLATAQ